jgi:disulfide bond formation protein DsbB
MVLFIMIRTARPLALFVLVASLGALGVALLAQYGYGLRPCVLCLAQRVPFAVAGLLAAAALPPVLGPVGRRRLLVLAGIAFLINSGIAIYHVGVEQHLWSFPVCAGGGGRVDVHGLAAQMSRPVVVPCDQPAWSWHGLTMAGLNVFYSGGLALVTLVLAFRLPGVRVFAGPRKGRSG